jgi:hypothetical protein
MALIYTNTQMSIKTKSKNKKPPTISVSVFLRESECKTLRRVSRKAWESGGKKLPVSTVLKGLVRAAKSLKVDLVGVRTEAELVARLKDSILK